MNGLGLINPTTALTSGLFGYLTNGKYYDSLINHSPRIAGALQVAGGIANLVFAAAAGVTGIGAPLSATIGFVAIDNIQAGARAIYTNQDTSTYGAELIAWSGLVPEKYSEIAYGLFDIGIAGKAALTLKTASQSHNIIKFSALKTSGKIKPTDIRVKVENISLNQRNVIELKEVNNVNIFRIQGGQPPNVSKELINIDLKGNVRIKESTLNISMGEMDHALYFISKRSNAKIASFEIPEWLAEFVKSEAIPQINYKSNPLNQMGMAPKIVDPTTPGTSYELPSVWSKWLEEYAIKGSGKIIKR